MEVAAPRQDPRLVRQDPIRAVARGLETAFLTEMLKSTEIADPLALPGNAPSPFASILVHTLAERISENGGIGLAESIYRQLSRANG